MYDSGYFAVVDRSYRNFDILRFKTVITHLELLARGGVAMDAGSGGGHYLGVLSKKFKATVGFEYSKDGIKGCVKNLPPRAILVNGDLTKNLPFADNSFDFILCSETLEHLEDPSPVLSELKRILKKGGKALITVPNFTKLSFEYLREIVSYKDPTHLHRYSYCKWFRIVSKHFSVADSFTSSFHLSYIFYLSHMPLRSLIKLEGFYRKLPLLRGLGRECVFLVEK